MENFSNKHLLIVILILILIPIVVVTATNSSLMDDASNFLLNFFSACDEGKKWYIENIFNIRARASSLFFMFLPLNIAHGIFKISDFNTLTHIYSCTLFTLPIIMCLYSIFLLFRAGRQHFMLFPLLLLSIGYFPVFSYGCVEAHFSAFCFFVFFLYFLLNIKFKIYDYIAFFILSIAILNLHESIVLVAPFIIYTYFKHSDKNNKFLLFGVVNICISVLLHFLFAFTPIGPEILESNAIESTTYFLYSGLLTYNKKINFHLYFYIITAINFFYMYKSKNNSEVVKIAICTLITSIVLLSQMFPYLYKSYRFMTVYFLIIILFFFLKIERNPQMFSQDIFKKSIPFLITSFLIANLYICIYSGLHHSFSTQLVKSEKEGCYYIEDKIEDYQNNNFYKYNVAIFNNNVSLLSYSIIATKTLDKKNEAKSLILSKNKDEILSLYCKDRLNGAKNALKIKMKTKYWDLNPIKTHIEESCGY